MALGRWGPDRCSGWLGEQITSCCCRCEERRSEKISAASSTPNSSHAREVWTGAIRERNSSSIDVQSQGDWQPLVAHCEFGGILAQRHFYQFYSIHDVSIWRSSSVVIVIGTVVTVDLDIKVSVLGHLKS